MGKLPVTQRPVMGAEQAEGAGWAAADSSRADRPPPGEGGAEEVVGMACWDPGTSLAATLRAGWRARAHREVGRQEEAGALASLPAQVLLWGEGPGVEAARVTEALGPHATGHRSGRKVSGQVCI